MTKNEVYELGLNRGFSIASWNDLPNIGDSIPRELDWIGVDKVTEIEDAFEFFMSICSTAESNNREYTPFEFTCKDLNELEEKVDFEVWETYEKGIHAGFEKNWKSRLDYYKD